MIHIFEEENAQLLSHLGKFVELLLVGFDDGADVGGTL